MLHLNAHCVPRASDEQKGIETLNDRERAAYELSNEEEPDYLEVDIP